MSGGPNSERRPGHGPGRDGGSVLARVAGAPITWGVCEVAGWGYQMPAERVLEEAAGIGLAAMELGPPGFLPSDPAAAKRMLDVHGLGLAAAFVAVVLHRPERVEASLAGIEAAAALVAGAGGGVLVLAAETGAGDYERSAELDAAEWRILADALDHAVRLGAGHGLEVVLHPHYGTVIETSAQIERLLDVSGIPLCVDTGHLLVGGADPLAVVERAGARVRHVHLKDVDASLAARVRRRELSYHAAVGRGLYKPLGAGDVNVPGVIERLESEGYRGWYVLEQDTVLAGVPAPREGPAAAAADSLRYLAELAA